MDPKGMDLSSLYQDDGYLTFNARPIEKRVEGDTIDIEIRMMEGQQFRIGRVKVQETARPTITWSTVKYERGQEICSVAQTSYERSENCLSWGISTRKHSA